MSDIFGFLKKHILLILILTASLSFFTRNNFKNAVICPQLSKSPLQTKIENPTLIKFKNNGYSYELTPLYNYEINALIVSKTNYKTFSLGKFGKAFAFDLCLIWGSNANSKDLKRLTFLQDCRWCFVQWFGDMKFNWEEFSNSHLLINNPEIEKKINSLVVGDQVRIKGKLVNVVGRLLDKPGTFDSFEYSWNSGVSKSGEGAGACKVIYVEEIEVLRKANLTPRFLFAASIYALLAVLIWKVLLFLNLVKPLSF